MERKMGKRLISGVLALILMLCCVRMAVHGIYVVMMGTALFWLAWA